MLASLEIYWAALASQGLIHYGASTCSGTIGVIHLLGTLWHRALSPLHLVCVCTEAVKCLYITSAPVYFPCRLRIWHESDPAQLILAADRFPRTPVAAGISLTQGSPQPDCLLWTTPLTEGVGRERSWHRQCWKLAEMEACPWWAVQGGWVLSWTDAWQNSTVQHFLTTKAQMKRQCNEVFLLLFSPGQMCYYPKTPSPLFF